MEFPEVKSPEKSERSVSESSSDQEKDKGESSADSSSNESETLNSEESESSEEESDTGDEETVKAAVKKKSKKEDAKIVCPLCELSYMSTTSCRQHFKRVHKDVSDSDKEKYNKIAVVKRHQSQKCKQKQKGKTNFTVEDQLFLEKIFLPDNLDDLDNRLCGVQSHNINILLGNNKKFRKFYKRILEEQKSRDVQQKKMREIHQKVQEEKTGVKKKKYPISENPAVSVLRRIRSSVAAAVKRLEKKSYHQSVAIKNKSL